MTQFFLKGDFRFFYPENIKDFATLPFAWDSSLNTGIGHSQIGSLWIISYFNFTSLFSKLGLSWSLIQLIFWVLPAILLSFFSSFYLFKTLFSREDRYSILAGIIYSFNTYFLMILTGGQLGVALAYSIAPLVLASFIKLIDNPSSQSYNFKFQISNFKLPIVAGLTLGLQIIFDPRIVYITLVTTFLYSVFNFSDIKRVIKNSLGFFVLPLIIAVLMNIFWILPLILTKSSPIPEGFNSVEGFKFFSFASFSHALSLLHPNWPENIFGKIYFLDPKFLVLPIIAFSSLLFKKNRNIVFFCSLLLLGVFLAKGANPPFGEINTWLFQNLPGMSIFRDPTKFYLFIALSYSVLIPFSLYNISILTKSKIKNQRSKIQSKFQIFNFRQKTNFVYFSYAFLIFAILYLIFLMSPIFGQIKVQQVPQEYLQLKNFLVNEKAFSRTLWIPQWQRYGFFSNNHPAIGREEVLKGDAQEQIKELKKESNLLLLKDLSIKYLIVPFDSQGEIFLEDRRYDKKKYEKTVENLRRVPYLTQLSGFEKIRVFEISQPKDHFWSKAKNLKIRYKYLNPTSYKVKVEDAKIGNILVFSEAFDKNWVIKSSKFKVQSSRFENLLNSFNLPKDGDYEFEAEYEPQKYVQAGFLISFASFLGFLTLLVFGKNPKKW